MKKNKKPSEAYIRKRREELYAIWESMHEEFSKEQIANAADNYGIDLSIMCRNISDEELSDVWPDIVSFVSIKLKEIDEDKAWRILESAKLPDDVINNYLYF